MRTLVDAFAIPDAWLNCAILREEPGRQETMAAHDDELRTGRAGAGEQVIHHADQTLAVAVNRHD
jgi:hypothetical protein